MIAWLILLWSVIGAAATATIERESDGENVTWHIEWEFPRTDSLRILLAGPLIWVMLLMTH